MRVSVQRSFVLKSLTNCFLSLAWIIFLLVVSLSSPSMSTSLSSPSMSTSLSSLSMSTSLSSPSMSTSLSSPSMSDGSSSDLFSNGTVVSTSLRDRTCAVSEPHRVHHFSDKANSGPADIATCVTCQEQGYAMEALKESLGIPDAMDWNGDPCLPTGWEGVKCVPDPQESCLVIDQIYLANKGLAGSIIQNITLLHNLTSLNLTKNLLVGIVPTEVYSIKLRNGTYDVSENIGLCGVGLPDVPQCSLFTVIGHGFTVLVVFLSAELIYGVLFMPLTNDEDDEFHQMAYLQGQFRINLAAIYTLFHIIRVNAMNWLIPKPDFDMRVAHYLWRLDKVHQLEMWVMSICAIWAIILRLQRHSRESHILAKFALLSLALSYSTVAMMRVFRVPWLVFVEVTWVMRTIVIMRFLIKVPIIVDLRMWFYTMAVQVLVIIRSLEWVEVVVIALALCKTMVFLNLIMAL
ncbi:unnamed protein product [Microthlaspi erraticum]|uniref:Leucine-rich repeat-containing N-terminal plant-type domain-containing protein n=1 Tax=Microthlaspi erraticum TaxID=1685480 RepID=A0A6D2IHC2_9BRAS|nr:unnamed protein product [Microthlaspi erraticum]